MAGLAALTLAYMLSQFYRSFMAVLTPALTAELGATRADLSLASGIWFATFALAQFVVGVCLDRYGPRRTSSIMLALGAGGGALLFAAASAPWMIVVAMALIGIGCAPVLMAAVFIFARTFRPAQLAVRTSWLVALGMAGNVVGTSPLAGAAEAFGWRWVMVGLAAVTLLVAATILLSVRDPERAEPGEIGFGFSGYRELLRIRTIWLLAPLVALGYAPAASIRGLWAGPYLSEVYGVDALVIGQVVLFMALAMVAGALIYGPLDTILRTRKWVAVVGNALGAAVILVLALNPVPGLTAVTILFVLLGMFGGTYGLLMAHGRAFLPPHLTGRGMTLLNFFSIGGSALLQFATGAVYTASYSATDPSAAYQALFWFYEVTLVAAIVVYLFVPDARPEKAAAEIGAAAR
jgi:MFS family permease